MENYGQYPPNSYPYPYPYPYPYAPQAYPPAPATDPDAFPPPGLPPPPPSQSYPHNFPHSFQYQHPQPSYFSNSGPFDQPPPPSHSEPLYYPVPPPYQYPAPGLAPPSYPHANPTSSLPTDVYTHPRPSLHNYGSFQHISSFSHHTHQDYLPRSPPSRSDSLPSYHRHESSESDVPGMGSDQGPSSTLYPPIDNLLDSVSLTDHSNPSAPPVVVSNTSHSTQSPSVPPSPYILNSSGSFQSSRLRYNQSSEMYGYQNNSFSEGSPHGPYSSSLSSSNDGSYHSQELQIVPLQPQLSKASRKVLLLHGSMDIWIFEAKNLPNMDMFSKTLKDMFGVTKPGSGTGKIEGRMHRSHTMTSDPYVSISVCNAVIGRTYVISNSENPVWTQHFNVPVAHDCAEVKFVVKDSDIVGSQLIGVVEIPAEKIYSGVKLEGTFPVLNTNGKPCNPGATLRLSVQYIPIEHQTMYNHGVGSGPDFHGVPGTYFPLRKGGNVTLYQDAHVPDGSLPDLKLDNGMIYEHGKCWVDIFEAISQARKLIYIVGWSVYHKVRLVRDTGFGVGVTLGDLLKSKSQEGVRVLLLVWDDPTSRKFWVLQTDGVMQTHDEETRRFFKHSSVQVLLCPRSAGKRHSWAKQQEVGAIYTHHQKTVIVDVDAGNNKRKIIAFVGGLDLCDGRYDTPKHSLFKTLKTVHSDDYHNPTFSGSAVDCPREPWHDLHCKIDGPAAYDVLTNFEDRWRKASKPRGIKKLKPSAYDDALLTIERIPDIVGMFDAPYLRENDPESWHVQVFRSIDSNSVKGFPKDPRDATNKNLVCGKNVLIDMSIHTAYVKAVRSAQHFIYIENQYFLGSSYNWSSHNDLGANNLIPMEIALKIANKIRVNERFAAYIVIPMWPEGVPTSVPTQRILFWQNKTMQMMYEIVYKALEEVGLEKKYEPQDYLNFFCLGNRENYDGNEASCDSPSTANTPQGLARKSRRFMIYVHSKGMIVDDEYVILGSANINQRSLEGTRDTEIAMGAYQPQHTWARKQQSPQGKIYGYRMSLWAEHTGAVEECFTQPHSLECVRKVRAIGERNWRQFAADEVTEMKGHLLKYPVDVDAKGKVRPLPGNETFPDVGGTIVGTFFAIQENLTI
ncbi:phospholipase D gamma 1-like [Aristolochia californica]|uniref:phospholipase D gamma 1-like n=1 Tax=Aristolochia californica TaxID=171875 RepID=UPI0035D84FA8